MAMADLPVIQRPDGSLYRPRQVTAHAVCDDDEFLSGVMILGTHDVPRAQRFADRYAAHLEAGYTAADPVTGWWRDGFEGGQRRWVTDEKRGRAGVWFRQIAERTSADLAAGRKDTTEDEGEPAPIDMGYLSLPAEVQAAAEQDVAERRKGGGDA
jgi:hypothetical protein